MKKKLIASIVLVTIILSILFNFSYNKVAAYSGEIDPKGYIVMPGEMIIENGQAKGTISLTSTASGFSIAYQKVDMTDAQFNTVDEKRVAYESYYNTEKPKLDAKQENVNNLKKAYDDANSAEPKVEETVQSTKKAYDDAVTAYNSDVDAFNNKIAELMKSVYSAMPDFTDSWISTAPESNNVTLQFPNASGTIHFVLWAKITKGNETYYDAKIYSTEIGSSGVTPGGATSNGNTTDFSKAKFELKKGKESHVTLEITGIKPITGHYYDVYVTDTAERPTNVSSSSGQFIRVSGNTSGTSLVYESGLEEYVELNKDMYITIAEGGSNIDYSIVIEGKKLTKPTEPKYSDAFYATFVSNAGTQIVTNFTHSEKNNRKIQVKVGKITDTSILQKIKNQDSSGFGDLLKYAKSNSGMYDKVLDATEKKTQLGYGLGAKYGDALGLTGITGNTYYYLYVKTQDENGKYVSNEAVTLACTDDIVAGDSWQMTFYGADDFKWADFGTAGGDTPTQPTQPSQPGTEYPGGQLPQTGVTLTIVFATLGVVVIAIVCAKKVKKYTI